MFRRIVPLILIFSIVFGVACTRRQASASGPTQPPPSYAVNINTASIEELQKIPHVGESIAKKIIAHREIHGPFRRVEHLMLIQGISDKRFRKIRPLVRVE
jgi:competence ComEA-like helix-hairpin-helix protein